MTKPELNQAQRLASVTLAGGVIVVAGAGAGKTRTLTERFVNAVVPDRVPGWEAVGPAQVVAITFTDKAAGELSERVRTALRHAGRTQEARSIDGAWISTIHGMCARILRRHALDAGIEPGFAVADRVASSRLKEQAFEEAALSSIESGAHPESTFGPYAFDVIYYAAERIRSSAAARGLEPVVAHPPGDAAALRSEALAFFGEARGAFASCDVDAPTVHAYHDACAGIEESLLGLEHTAMDPEELAEAVWLALAAHKATRTTKKEVRDECEEFHAVRDRLLGVAAACALHPLTTALIDLAAEFGSRYAALKSERGLLDFDDLQVRTLSLFGARPDILQRYREDMRLFMVDEFQDTDALQLDIVRALAGDHLCTVGDERQSIYAFRGADVEVFRRHVARATQEGAACFELDVNYRSHPEILEFANRVFGKEGLFGRELLRLGHGRKEPEPPVIPDGVPRVGIDIVHSAGRPNTTGPAAEASILAQRLAGLRDDNGVAPSQMVVLVRQYRDAVPIAAALRSRGFQVLTVGGSRFFELEETVWLRALCRALANPKDDRALLGVLVSPLADLSDDLLIRIRASADDTGSPYLWDGVTRLLESADGDDVHPLRAAAGALESARSRLGAMPLSEIVLRVVEESGVDLALLAAGDEGRERYANVLKFARMADEYERTEGSGPAGFTAYLDARERYGEHEAPVSLADDESPAVRIMSVHASKGLEFPVVAVGRLAQSRRTDGAAIRVLTRDGALEVALRVPADWKAKVKADGGGEPKEEVETAEYRDIGETLARADSEEAKRLLYVACTRARDALLLFGTTDHEKTARGDSPLSWLYAALPSIAEAGVGEDVELTDGGVVIGRVRVTAIEDVPAEEAPKPFAQSPIGMAPPAVSAPPPGDDGSTGTPLRELSYSQIATFGECPRKFWARHVVRIGESARPGPTGSRGFGSAVHAALQLGPAALLADGRLDAIARVHGLDREGSNRLRHAVDALGRSNAAARLEECETVRREVAFAIPVGGDGTLLLVGSLDVYGKAGRRGLVVDYKTGSTGTGQGLRSRYENQARCYALAALADGCESADVVFVRPEVPADDGTPQEIAFRFDESESPGIAAWIVETAELISSSGFAPLPGWEPGVCGDCPAARIACAIIPPGGDAAG